MSKVVLWTDDMDADLVRYVARRGGYAAIARKMSLDSASVRYRVRRLGLKIYKRPGWSDDRNRLLKQLFSVECLPVPAIAKRLDVTSLAVTRHAYELGLRRPPTVKVPVGKWTPAEIKLALEMRAELDDGFKASTQIAEEIALKIGRSPTSVYTKFWKEQGRGQTLNGSSNQRAIESAREATEVEQAAQQYLNARERRSLSATLMGDPPPGYSALDQRRSAE